MRFQRSWAMIVAACLAFCTGCGGLYNYHYIHHGSIPWPWAHFIPVPQVIGDEMQAHIEKDYAKVPMMPPVRDYAPVFCMDPPSEYDIVRAMQKPNRHPSLVEAGIHKHLRGTENAGILYNIPFFYEKHYNNMEFVVEKIVDSLDDCRFYPLVGPAQLHHCHYKVTIYYDQIRHSAYPFAWEVKDKDVQVVFIDKDHLHICTSPEMEAIPESYQDIYGAY